MLHTEIGWHEMLALLGEEMNKKYILRIPIKTLVVEDGEEVVRSYETAEVTINTMLTPMYASEAEVLSMFVDEEEYEKYYLKTREIIFNSSIRANDYLSSRLKLIGLSPEHVLLFKRELATCYAVNGMANHLYKNYGESISRSKTLGEFTVSTSVKNSTIPLRSIMESSKECTKEAKKAIDELTHLAASMGMCFDKGSWNISNRFSYRLWFHNHLPERSSQIFATTRHDFNGNKYKDGTRGINVPKSRTYYPQGTI